MPRPRFQPSFLADGLLIVDKPAGLTSADVVAEVKHMARPAKIGHAGTLDPFATGVLVLCFNQATKLAGYLLDQDKVYEGIMLLGVETATQDLTGPVVARKPVTASEKEILAAARSFLGTIVQRPPVYSALKQGGEPLYRKARRGEEVTVEPREVTIHALEVTRIQPPLVHFTVHCSKGTYIRTLAHDWGKKLGCGGHLENLRRLKSGRFAIEQALLLGQVEAAVRKGVLERVLISPQKALDWPGAVIDEPAAKRVAEGQSLAGAELQGLPLARLKVGQRLTLSTPAGRLVALAELALSEHGPGLTARPLRVLQA